MIEGIGFVLWTLAAFLAGAFCTWLVIDILDELKKEDGNDR